MKEIELELDIELNLFKLNSQVTDIKAEYNFLLDVHGFIQLGLCLLHCTDR